MSNSNEELTEWLQQATEYIKKQFTTPGGGSADEPPAPPEKRAAEAVEATKPEPEAKPKKKHFWFGETDG